MRMLVKGVAVLRALDVVALTGDGWLCHTCHTDLQGSADDEEDWAVLAPGRLTPALFWQHHAAILGADSQACAQLVESIVQECGTKGEGASAGEGERDSPAFAWVRRNQEGNAGIAVGKMRAGQPPDCWLHFDAIICVSPDECPGMPPSTHDAPRQHYLHMPLAEGKRDARSLEQQMPTALQFAATHLAKGARLCVAGGLGSDRPVAVCMAILLSFFRSSDSPEDQEIWGLMWSKDELEALARLHPRLVQRRVAVGAGAKHAITRCLHSLAIAWPCAAPSRHRCRSLSRFFGPPCEDHKGSPAPTELG